MGLKEAGLPILIDVRLMANITYDATKSGCQTPNVHDCSIGDSGTKGIFEEEIDLRIFTVMVSREPTRVP